MKFNKDYEILKHKEQSQEVLKSMGRCHLCKALYLNLGLLMIGESVEAVKSLTDKWIELYSKLGVDMDAGISPMVDFLLEMLARPYCKYLTRLHKKERRRSI